MSRSLKKGPYTNEKLMKKVTKARETGNWLITPLPPAVKYFMKRRPRKS